jgi:hypothetical protein
MPRSVLSDYRKCGTGGCLSRSWKASCRVLLACVLVFGCTQTSSEALNRYGGCLRLCCKCRRRVPFLTTVRASSVGPARPLLATVPALRRHDDFGPASFRGAFQSCCRVRPRFVRKPSLHGEPSFSGRRVMLPQISCALRLVSDHGHVATHSSILGDDKRPLEGTFHVGAHVSSSALSLVVVAHFSYAGAADDGRLRG